DPNVWGRYIAGALGVDSDINVSAADANSPGLYQVTIECPNYAQNGGGESNFTYSAAGTMANIILSPFYFGQVPATDGKNPNIFQAIAVDQFGIKSLPFTRTIQVIPVPSWLQTEFLPTQSIDSSVTYDPSKYQYNLRSHAVVLKLDSTLNQLLFNDHDSIPMFGDLDNQLLFELTTTATVSLNPHPAGVQYIHPDNSARFLVRVLGADVFNETYKGESQTVDHISVSIQSLLDPVTLVEAAEEVTAHIHDLPLREETKKIPLVKLGLPGVLSVDATLTVKYGADLEGAISFGLSNSGDIGLLSPTFLGIKDEGSATISGSVNVLGVDAAELEGSITASVEIDYGLSTRVPLGNFERLTN